MRRGRLLLLTVTCLLASLTVATAYLAFPQAMRIALGLLIVLVLPGFAVVCAVLPAPQLSSGEQLLASVGMSLAFATCAAVILAATPIGLSRESFAIGLGGSTVALSTYAAVRTRLAIDTRGRRGTSPNQDETWDARPPLISREDLR